MDGDPRDRQGRSTHHHEISDMPHRTRAQERIDELDVSPAKLAAEIERLQSELAASKKQADEYLAALQRERAEFSNFRRRTSEEREQWLGLASESLIRKVLAIADDFDRAIEAMPPELADNPWAQGVAAIDRKLRQLLESEGVRPLESVGQPFDPREHEAISNVQDTGRPAGEVVAEIQRGYKLRDRVLRPALVAVASDGDGAGQSRLPDEGSGDDRGQGQRQDDRPRADRPQHDRPHDDQSHRK
jgi:molecular chaperone GrpE